MGLNFLIVIYLDFQNWNLFIRFPKKIFRASGLRKFWTILTALFQNVMKPHHLLVHHLVFDKYCDKNRLTRKINFVPEICKNIF